MSFKTKIKLVLLSCVCLTAALFAGCKIGGVSKDEFLESKGVAGQYVTYYANGGQFNGKNREEMDVYFAAGNPILCTQTKNFTVDRKNHTFDGWYFIESENDKPKLDGDGNYIFGEKIEGSFKVETGVHLFAAAQWIANAKIEFFVVTDDGNPVTGTDGVEYPSYDVDSEENVPYSEAHFSKGAFGLDGNLYSLKVTDAYFLWFYSDPECTKPVDKVGEPEEGSSDVPVFVKYTRSPVNVVSTAAEVSDMFSDVSSGKEYYLLAKDGSGVINCSTALISVTDSDFNIKIEGNGVTLENLTFRSPAGAIVSRSYSIFGNISATAKIKDLTLKNVTAQVGPFLMATTQYLVCSSVAAGAEIDGLIIDTAKLSVDANSLRNTDEWLFGGMTADEFVQTYGVVIINASLSVKGNDIAENVNKPSAAE